MDWSKSGYVDVLNNSGLNIIRCVHGIRAGANRMNQKELRKQLTRLQSIAYKLQTKISDLVGELDKP